MQGLNKDFYGKVIPGILRKIPNPSFSFVFSYFEAECGCEDETLDIVFQHISKQGETMRLQQRYLSNFLSEGRMNFAVIG